MTSKRPQKNKRAAASPDHANLPDKVTAPQPSRGRRWCYRILAVTVVPVVFFGLIEAGLRLGGYGYPTAFFRKIPGQDAYTTNPKFGWRFFPRALNRRPLSIRLPADKTDGTYRIFVLGGSAARGTPSPEFAFDRILSVMLEDAYPDVDWQIVNAGMTAINSNVVLPIARECAQHDPDMFIVYMGNNEVVGPFGAATVFGNYSPRVSMIRGGIAVKATRTGQLLQALTQSLNRSKDRPTEWRGMAMFMENTVAADDPRMANVYKHFGSTLEDICRSATGADAKTLLCTVPVNLKDCPPFASQHRPGLGGEGLAEWEQVYQAGVDAEEAGDPSAAIEHYMRAREIDDRYAELHYRLGRCYLADGRAAEALPSFVAARDLDTLRFRADVRINEIIRRTARELKDRGVFLVDTEAIFGQIPQAPGLPGYDLFYEHVHLEFAGNYAIARALFDRLVPLLPASIRSQTEAAPAALSKDQCAERLALTAWGELRGLENIAGLAAGPPFTGQLGHGRRLRDLRLRVADLRRQQTPAAAEQACRVFTEALARRPDDTVLRRNFGEILFKLERPAEAEACFLEALAALPADPYTLMLAGLAAGAQGKIAEGEAYLQQSVEISPNPAQACLELSLSFRDGGMWEKTLSYAMECLDYQPDHPRGLYSAGLAHLRMGQHAQAIEFLRRSIAIDPNSSDAHCDLASALRNSGKMADAVATIEVAARADPLAARPRFIQARICHSQGKLDQAGKLYELAIYLQPDYSEAQHAYAGLLAQQGDYAQALKQYQQALVFGPQSARIRIDLAELLATCPKTDLRDPVEAGHLAGEAVALTRGRNPMALDVLAVCLAEAGQFDKALDISQQALTLAAMSGQRQAIERIKKHRELFAAGRRVSEAEHADAPSR